MNTHTLGTCLRFANGETCIGCGDPERGRSIPLGMDMCTDDCSDYYNDPKPGDLWPREMERDFGYPVSRNATEDLDDGL